MTPFVFCLAKKNCFVDLCMKPSFTFILSLLLSYVSVDMFKIQLTVVKAKHKQTDFAKTLAKNSFSKKLAKNKFV